MKNDTGNRIFTRLAARTVRVGVLVCFSGNAALIPLTAWADVPPPPPAYHKQIDTSFPSGRALINQGYDPKTGVLKVQVDNSGKPKVSGKGGVITGRQDVNVTVTDTYGNKAKVKTTVGQSVSSKLLTGAVVGNLVGNASASAYKRYGSELESNLSNGNYGAAFVNSTQIIGAVVDGFLTGGAIGDAIEGAAASRNSSMADSVVKGAISSLNRGGSFSEISKTAASSQAKAERQGDVSGAVVSATVKKAAEAAEKAASVAEKIDKGKTTETYWVASAQGQYAKYGDTPENACSGEAPGSNGLKFFYVDGSCLGGVDKPTWLWGLEAKTVKLKVPDLKQSDVSLSSGEIAAILKNMAEQQQANHEEMMRQLTAIAGNTAVQNATTSKSVTPVTVLTDPYTPAGSNTPQQTEFSLKSDGSISARSISRPDLVAGSFQAPRRTEIVKNTTLSPEKQLTPESSQQDTNQGTTQGSEQGTNQGTTQGTQQGTNQGTTQGSQQGTTQGTAQGSNQGQQNDKQDFCRQNPNSASCADLGDTSYEDLDIPEKTIDLQFKPIDVFATDGTCPAPIRYELGSLGSFEMGYDYICSFLRMIRPIVILGTIITCSMIAYSAVKEL
ncbi:virulence factor TspB C-terminal domain-related protein [Neisseria zalophi]|uniref:TspB protein n=1 Tax=Neisseria zalophi TaxID=640030 RepID=A0A5J6Q0D7_9NEIS|nr:virulence factor TspB C-terminal domain-related protein [Neisseria zalophi]QEY26507.1 hypothetical protein D0T92_08175 [Neisseria zalophi]